MEQITVYDLYQYCSQEIARGNSNKNIVISDDNEGNGYHGLFFGFTPIDNASGLEDLIYDSHTTNGKDTIILG